ncbi:hypothetical protein [Chryseobacterium kwangjuense]|uniref:Natural product n=1 Tax=Chryseobacterium kwangjuense TaxID=267125 RepID=A0ABW9JWL7_9FLAO|nr:hypothetical protein [Chryseobacterium kwangjuense]
MKTKTLNVQGAKFLDRKELKKVNGGAIRTPVRCCEKKPNGQCMLWWPIDQECP